MKISTNLSIVLPITLCLFSTTQAEHVGLTVEGIHAMTKQLKTMVGRQNAMYGNADSQMLTVFSKPEKDWTVSWNTMLMDMNLLLDTIRLAAIGADQVSLRTDKCKNVVKAHREFSKLFRKVITGSEMFACHGTTGRLHDRHRRKDFLQVLRGINKIYYIDGLYGRAIRVLSFLAGCTNQIDRDGWQHTELSTLFDDDVHTLFEVQALVDKRTKCEDLPAAWRYELHPE